MNQTFSRHFAKEHEVEVLVNHVEEILLEHAKREAMVIMACHGRYDG
jgi:hypothetical protein